MMHFKKAAWALNRTISLNPDQPEAWYDIGNVLYGMGQTENAIEAYQRCLSLNPEHIQSITGLGKIYFNFGNVTEAKKYLEKILHLNHFDREAIAFLRICGPLDPFETNASILDSAKKMNLYLNKNMNLKRAYYKDNIVACVQDPGSKINIGFHCSFFDSYGVNMFFTPILEYLDRSCFNIYIYGFGMNQSVKSQFTCRQTHQLPDEQFVKLIQGDNIHIIVDLDGPGARFTELRQRIAPVQVCYFNYPATSGIEYMDYFLADEIVIPEEFDKYYTEKVYRLRVPVYSFKFPINWPRTSTPPSLKNGFVTFGYFGNPIKLNSVLLSWWSTILNGVPGSKLLLVHNLYNTEQNKNIFLKRFIEAGFNKEQIVFHKGAPHDKLLSICNGIDISLDPFPYNGGHTTMESLSLGLPIVSLTGDRYISRHGKAFLAYSNLYELIATSKEDYIEKNIALANSPKRLKELRLKIPENVKDSLLCDTMAVGAEWSDAFKTMWNEYCKKEVHPF